MKSRGLGGGRRQVAEEAAEWLVTLQSADASRGNREAFVDWLYESPVHIAEMLRVTRVHGALSEFQDWTAVPPLDAASASTVVPLNAGGGATSKSLVPAKVPRGLAVLLAAAAAVVAILVAGLLYELRPPLIQTVAGERRELTLADGSLVEVAPSTSLKVTLGDRERRVFIADGQAFFHVRKDPDRPFVVDTSYAQIRAVGTAFNVSRSTRGVVVTVTEGRVAISEAPPAVHGPFESQSAPRLLVGANEQVSISADGHVGMVRKVNGDVEIAWTVGQLEFDGQAIAEVAQRFNAYNRVQIAVQDPALARRRVTGVFRIADPESFVTFIEATTPGATVRREGDIITIARNSLLGTAPASPH